MGRDYFLTQFNNWFSFNFLLESFHVCKYLVSALTLLIMSLFLLNSFSEEMLVLMALSDPTCIHWYSLLPYPLHLQPFYCSVCPNFLLALHGLFPKIPTAGEGASPGSRFAWYVLMINQAPFQGWVTALTFPFHDAHISLRGFLHACSLTSYKWTCSWVTAKISSTLFCTSLSMSWPIVGYS